MLSYCIYVPGIYVNVIYYTQTGGNICFVQGHFISYQFKCENKFLVF